MKMVHRRIGDVKVGVRKAGVQAMEALVSMDKNVTRTLVSLEPEQDSLHMVYTVVYTYKVETDKALCKYGIGGGGGGGGIRYRLINVSLNVCIGTGKDLCE